MLFILLSAYNAVEMGLKLGEYRVYWLKVFLMGHVLKWSCDLEMCYYNCGFKKGEKKL